jgi:DNA-binding MarR family transcriptional regulator
MSRSQAAVEEAIVVSFFDIANHLARRGEALARRAGLSTPQWLALLEIGGDSSFGARRSAAQAERTKGAGRGVLASEMADRRGVSRATMSVLVAQLIKLGYVRCDADPEDGRRKLLQLTPDGRQALDAIEPMRRQANRRLLGALSPEERTLLARALGSCLDLLTATPGDR